MLDTTIGGRYKIIRTLGGGGFGETFVAEDLQLPDRMHCVVKRLRPQSNDPFVLQTARRLFETEAKVLHMLGKHGQIPQLLAHFEENQEFYLVQELIAGNSLAEELTQPMGEPYAIALLLDILPILEFVHQQNVIHRDLKPANLIRRHQDGKLVLIDFGAVKQIRSQLASTPDSTNITSNVTVAIGTPGYMPSEQSSGKPRPCSDIYALGAIAIQALTGIPPEHLADDPTTGEIVWHQLAPVSPGLAGVIDRMVRYDFRTRYQSATEVLDALKHLSQPLAQPIAATEVSVPPDRANPYYPSPPTQQVVPFASPNQSRFPWKMALGIGSIVAISAAIPAVMLNLPKSPQPVQVVIDSNVNTPANPKSSTNKPNIPTSTPSTPNTPEPIVEANAPQTSELNYGILSSRLIAETDLEGLSEIELDLMRNAIFARYGRRFKDTELQTYFDRQSWYRPTYEPDAFPDNLLADIEKQNAQFILAYQQNLAQHQAQNPCYRAAIRFSRDPTSPLNVRSGPGTEFAIAGSLLNGTQITVVGEQKGWLQISAPIPGWVAKSRTGCPG
jgi:serine/threonine protein kinase